MSLEGSKSTVYGSLKSSRSSTTIFGSCISTDTIGSFHTAKSCAIGSSTQTIGSFHTARSCSTLYFSAKEEDSNTLNWTMNYGSFDELSDTSTLVGDHEEPRDVSEVASVTSASEIRMDIKHSPEAESEEAHILMEEDDGCSTSTQIIDPIMWVKAQPPLHCNASFLRMIFQRRIGLRRGSYIQRAETFRKVWALSKGT